jgi:hypothetical protein
VSTVETYGYSNKDRKPPSSFLQAIEAEHSIQEPRMCARCLATEKMLTALIGRKASRAIMKAVEKELQKSRALLEEHVVD